MADQNNNIKLIKWLNKELTDEALEESTDREEISAYKQILDEVDQWVPDNNPRIFDPKEITSQTKGAKVRKLNSWIPISVAASLFIAFLAGIWFLYLPGETAYVANAGETLKIVLPDGSSSVTLAAGSKVSWEKEDWSDNQRKLYLEGKGFFEVEKGSPFTVNTRNGKVEVLGTQFEVDQFAGSLSIACYDGRVRGTSLDGQSLILNRGEKSLYYSNRWEIKGSLEEKEPTWLLQNESKFDNAPLSQVFETLEKVFDITIDSGGINLDRRFTGSFPNDDLELALSIIAKPFGISYEVKDESIVLSE